MSLRLIFAFFTIIGLCACEKHDANNTPQLRANNKLDLTDQNNSKPSSGKNPILNSENGQYYLKEKLEKIDTVGGLLGVQEDGEVIFAARGLNYFNGMDSGSFYELNVLTKEQKEYKCDFKKLDSLLAQKYPYADKFYDFKDKLEVYRLDSHEVVFVREICLYCETNPDRLPQHLKKEVWFINRQSGSCEIGDMNSIGERNAPDYSAKRDYSSIELPSINAKISVELDRPNNRWNIRANGKYTLDNPRGYYAKLFPIQNNTNAVLLTSEKNYVTNDYYHELYVGFGDFKNSSVFNRFVYFYSGNEILLSTNLKNHQNLVLIYPKPDQGGPYWIRRENSDIFLVDLSK